jgi:hypothetical protein
MAGRKFAVLLFAVLLGPVGACTGSHCDNVDHGSCGNACCKLEWSFPDRDAIAVMTALNTSVHAGGPDGLYFANVMYEGGTGFADLRPFKAPASFIGQATRTTPPLRRFNDTLNFAVYSHPEVCIPHVMPPHM